MATVLNDLITLLTTELPGETIRGGFLPTSPDRVVGLIEQQGEEPPAETFVGFGRGPKLNMETPVIQVLVRTPQDCYEDSRELAEDTYRALHNQTGILISGTRYALIEALQPPFNLGIDEQGRWLSGFNIRCWKKPN